MSFLTTLTSAFKGGGGSRVPVSRGFISPWATAFDGSTRRPFDYGSALREAFVENPVAQRAVRIVAEGVGSAPLSDTDPRLLALIRVPSAGQSLVETLALHLSLHGNAYVQIAKDAAGHPIELFALRPERVSVLPGPDGWPRAYDYRLADRTLTIALEDKRCRSSTCRAACAPARAGRRGNSPAWRDARRSRCRWRRSARPA